MDFRETIQMPQEMNLFLHGGKDSLQSDHDKLW